MSTISIGTLFTTETANQLLTAGLELAAAVGLPVESWRVGDPTRTLFKFVSEILGTRDSQSTEFIRAGFLTTAAGSWKTLVAEEFFGVIRQEATQATSTISLSNSGGGQYDFGIGEVWFKNSTTGELFRNTEALSIASGPGTTATVAVIAENAGSDGTSAVDEIDEIVTTMLGVSITGSTAAVGIDEQSDESLEAECLDSLGSISVNGPPDAYKAVVKNEDLTGVTDITRAWTSEDASDGTVTVWVAGPSGPVAAASVTAAQTAVETWATPATITPTVTNSTAAPQTVAYTVSGDDIPGTAEADISALVAALFAAIDIGGLVAQSALISLAHEYLVDAGATSVTVTLTSPSADVDLANGAVPTVSSVTVTEV